MSTTNDRARAVTFACRATDAQAVFLAGAFNGWSADALPMHKDATGKFLVDGEWCAKAAGDSESERVDCVPKVFGTENRVLEVS